MKYRYIILILAISMFPSTSDTTVSEERKLQEINTTQANTQTVKNNYNATNPYNVTTKRKLKRRSTTAPVIRFSDEPPAAHYWRATKRPKVLQKSGNPRRKISYDEDFETKKGSKRQRDRERPVIHYSRDSHKFKKFFTYEDRVGAAKWAQRWFLNTTKSYYRNVTLELVTLPSGTVRTWVTVCPGQNNVKFKVRTDSDAIIYLADKFYPGNAAGLITAPLGNFVLIRIGDGSNWPWKWKDQRSMICYKQRVACYTNYAIHLHPHQERYLSAAEYRGFWIWWEPNGLILVGKENEAPFMSLYLTDYGENKWKVRAVGFGDVQISERYYNHPTWWQINVEFPIHEDPDFDDHNDELERQDITT